MSSISSELSNKENLSSEEERKLKLLVECINNSSKLQGENKQLMEKLEESIKDLSIAPEEETKEKINQLATEFNKNFSGYSENFFVRFFSKNSRCSK